MSGAVLASARRAAPWWLARAHARLYGGASILGSADARGTALMGAARRRGRPGPECVGFFENVRRRSRAAGLPAHHPFLDLIDAVLRLPPRARGSI
jgi:hypothetical protein